MVRRGEVWLIRLDPTVGSEIQKTRPCLVISPDELNAHLRTALVAPMTTGSRAAKFRVPLEFEGKTGRILLDQVRAVDRDRLAKRLGRIDARTLDTTLAVLRELFAQ